LIEAVAIAAATGASLRSAETPARFLDGELGGREPGASR
jgi:hypothetical protein